MDSIDDILHVLFSTTSPERDAVHEAGHRFFWRICFPNVRTRYGRNGDGLPAVIPERGACNIVLANLSIREASNWIYIKLGGYSSEIVYLGHADRVEAIAERIVLDWFNWEEGHGRFDWEEELLIGDIPNVVSIIKSKSEWTIDIAMRNFTGFFRSCVENIQNNKGEYEEECRRALKFFCRK